MNDKQENLEFPVQSAYFVGSLVLVNEKYEILLVKERNNNDIWTVPGGEVDYDEKEQFIDSAIRETEEEVGINLNQNDVELIDTKISYAQGDNPYKDNGIFIPVVTYIAKFPEEQEIKLKRSEDEVERKYDVEEYIWIKPNEINGKKIKIHDNFLKTIPIIEKFINKNYV
ncbi:MAG: NUDIX hydrolase [Candidatus Pacebacteria bacterium]|nr:NUDIX hydrolase [Candidatus Paceibacterota bacterium]